MKKSRIFRKNICILLIIGIFTLNLFSIIEFPSTLIKSKEYYNDIKDKPPLIHISSSGAPNADYFIHYKVITINHEMVQGLGNHINYPLLLSIYDSDLHNDTQAGGNDIAFANQTSWLDHEIESYNQLYNSSHAKLIVWVRIPSLSTSTDTYIFMYYGNSTMGPRENPEGVWDSSYKGVWHLKEDPGPGNPGDIKDSTSNDNDGTAEGTMTSDDQISGQIDGSIDFDGVDDYIEVGNVGIAIKSVSFWMKADAIQSTAFEDSGYKNPSATGDDHNDWTNPTNAYVSDNSYTTSSNIGEKQDWYNFSINIPMNVDIEGISVFIEGKSIGGGTCSARLSWDGGTSYSSQRTYTFTNFEEIREFGSPTNTWGRTWDTSEFSDGNFRVRLEKIIGGSGTLQIDQIRVKVYYSYLANISIVDLNGSNQVLIDKDTSEIKTINFPGTTTIYINGAVGSTINTGIWYYITVIDTTGVDVSALDIARASAIYFDGCIDEIHLVDSVRSAEWIITEYNNYYDPYSFYFLGEEDNVDEIPPFYSDLIESSNPLELGESVVITINVTDPSGVMQVKLEFEGSNYSMENIYGNTYQYDSWKPDNVENYTYTIYMQDFFNNWNSTSGIIVVVDTIAPTYSNLIESGDPLKFGQNETISIKVFDLFGSGVNQVLIEYDSANQSMNFVGEYTWSWSNWKPTIEGLHNYTIYMQDKQDNWNMTSGIINVITTTAPFIENLIENEDPLELGNDIIITVDIFDNETWISFALFELDGFNYTMINITSDTYFITFIYNFNWTNPSVGTISYKIYANDTGNNWNSLTSSFEIIDTTAPVYSALNESENPLELGNTEVISITATDLTGIKQLRIEFEGTNYSMINIGGNTWQYNQWTPSSTGNISYIIWIEDNNNNWNFTIGMLIVQDTICPSYSNLTENADPIEIGTQLIISINITDQAGIKQVSIEYDNVNHTMGSVGGNIWQYDSWITTSSGIYPYTIYMKDMNNNMNFINDTITFQDTISPIYSDLSESADPNELGTSLIISITVTDQAGINQVLIEYDNENHTMENVIGNIWQYNSWMPTSKGNYSYKIYMEDVNNNMNYVSDSIIFQDTICPSYSNLIENSDPLELGNSLVINIDVIDFAGINITMIEFEGFNHSMTNIYGNTWQYDLWSPNSSMVYLYRIFMKDNSGNWNSITSNVTVQDTLPPSPPLLTNGPSGDVSGNLVFDWLDGNDPSGIIYYILIIDNETDPSITPGYVYFINITNDGSISSYYELTETLPPGRYYYFLAQIDGIGHHSSYTIGSFTINLNQNNNNSMIYIVIVIALISILGSITGVVIMRKKSQKKLIPPRKKIPLKIILSHIRKISASLTTSGQDQIQNKSIQNVDLPSTSSEISREEELEQLNIEEINRVGEELFKEGAYLEAIKYFEQIMESLTKMGKDEEVVLISELINGIKKLIKTRETRIEELEREKINGNSIKIFELYQDLIEISEKLRDFDGVNMFNSEMIDYFDANKVKLIELQKYNFKLEEQAESSSNAGHYEKAVQEFEKCEQISSLLMNFSKNEFNNIKRFRNKKEINQNKSTKI